MEKLDQWEQKLIEEMQEILKSQKENEDKKLRLEGAYNLLQQLKGEQKNGR